MMSEYGSNPPTFSGDATVGYPAPQTSPVVVFFPTKCLVMMKLLYLSTKMDTYQSEEKFKIHENVIHTSEEDSRELGSKNKSKFNLC
ncbi:hypothetical protein L1987_74311 [Smallanthus sonchifolius]|uniref:Uncharacterized protein n=1 Tax=Smallanthus sonchifolius TaxID=185202 RepID=A0ACB9A2K2_9ASTR|nr:hypothetical protein L1987_74311 [Smallanthus sonchifolius]